MTSNNPRRIPNHFWRILFWGNLKIVDLQNTKMLEHVGPTTILKICPICSKILNMRSIYSRKHEMETLQILNIESKSFKTMEWKCADRGSISVNKHKRTFESSKIWNFEIWNFEALQLGNFETLKLRNFETSKLCNFETLKLWNFETLKHWNSELNSWIVPLNL